ncbi:MAG: hypothetical protein V4658_14140 [Bacteroidota bacterium]
MKIILLSMLLSFHLYVFGQPLGMTIKDAEKKGITIQHLDSIYKSAAHADSTKAVFKSQPEQQELLKAYTQLLSDFGDYLHKNKFTWNRPTRCWNRIYFDSTGSIDYFLYNFLTKDVKPEDQVPLHRQAEFNRLLNLFIKAYKFPLKANTKFAQCSPVTYMPNEKRPNEQ